MSDRKKVVGYIRVSTEMQANDGMSLESQRLEIEKTCKIRDWDLVNIFEDRGISGSTIENRAGILNLLKYVKNHPINFICVTKVSRLSRKISEALYIVESLEQNNCYLLAKDDAVDTSQPMGKYFLTLGAIFAEMERENTVQQVKAVMANKALKGEWGGGKPPLGYDLLNKVLVINEEEASIVQTIFTEYLKGSGYKTIADTLNEQGKKTKANNKFSTNAVKSILKNPLYYGVIRWGHLENWGKLKNKKRQRTYNEEPIIVEGKHTAIISKDMFDKVQQKIETNPRHHLKRFNGNHLLSGLLKCPECGEYSMSIQSVKNKKQGKTYQYYICNQYQTYKTCSPKGINKEKIEAEFLKLFETKISNVNNLTAILTDLNNRDAQLEVLEQNIIQLNKIVIELKRKANNLIDIMAEGDLTADAKTMMKKNYEERLNEVQLYQTKIQDYRKKQEELANKQLDIETITKILKHFSKFIQVIDKKEQQELIRQVIEKITVKDSKIKDIYFKFEKDLKLTDEGDSDKDESPSQENSFRVESDTLLP